MMSKSLCLIAFLCFSSHISAKTRTCYIDSEFQPVSYNIQLYNTDVLKQNKLEIIKEKRILLFDLDVLKKGKPEHEIEDINDLKNSINQHNGSIKTLNSVWKEVINVSEYFIKGKCYS